MKKVTISIDDDIWKWWKNNSWINLSQLANRELRRIRALEERVHGTCPKCGNAKLKFNKNTYQCTSCGYAYK
jgi:tRNA(Ile2) C34 agmatinyltransferase TiaS